MNKWEILAIVWKYMTDGYAKEFTVYCDVGGVWKVHDCKEWRR